MMMSDEIAKEIQRLSVLIAENTDQPALQRLAASLIKAWLHLRNNA